MADKVYFIDHKGVQRSLTEGNYVVLKGMVGRYMPPIEYVEDEVPFESGSELRQVKVKTREVDIPLLIKAESEVELRQRVRQTLRMVNPLHADGKLLIEAPDKSQRELSCRYVTGLEGDEGTDNKGLRWMRVVLVFRAFDPYWYDTATITNDFKLNENSAKFFPFLPLRVTSSRVYADITVDNTGDIETYPEWIIQGPGENIVLNNLTTSEMVKLDLKLEAWETVTINTSKESITKNDGENLYPSLVEGSDLWALQEGMNSIQIEMTNATSESNVKLSYRNRYLGA